MILSVLHFTSDCAMIYFYFVFLIIDICTELITNIFIHYCICLIISGRFVKNIIRYYINSLSKLRMLFVNKHDKDEEDNDDHKKPTSVKCIICNENCISRMYDKCKHVCVCFNCSKSIQKCPVCRCETQTIRVYLP